jgi:hypothetical protein
MVTQDSNLLIETLDFGNALEHYKAGRLPEAEMLCLQVSATAPPPRASAARTDRRSPQRP